MVTIDLFSLGWVSPALSFGLSFVGALLGLIAVAHCRTDVGRGARVRWLAIAAGCAALLTTGIVGMHYVVMQGMSANIDDHRHHVGGGTATTAVSMMPLIILMLVLEAMMLFYALVKRSANDDEISTELRSWYTNVGVPSQRRSPSVTGARHRTALDTSRLPGPRTVSEPISGSQGPVVAVASVRGRLT